jgi:hypothetical protein
VEGPAPHSDAVEGREWFATQRRSGGQRVIRHTATQCRGESDAPHSDAVEGGEWWESAQTTTYVLMSAQHITSTFVRTYKMEWGGVLDITTVLDKHYSTYKCTWHNHSTG